VSQVLFSLATSFISSPAAQWLSGTSRLWCGGEFSWAADVTATPFLFLLDAVAAFPLPLAPPHQSGAKSTTFTESGKERGSDTEGETERGVAEEGIRFEEGGMNTHVGDDCTRHWELRRI